MPMLIGCKQLIVRTACIAAICVLVLLATTATSLQGIPSNNSTSDALRRYDAAIALVRNGRLSDGLRALELDALVAASPDSAKAHAARGVVLAMMKRIRESEAALRTATRLDSDFAEAHFNLGKLLLESARSSEAKDELRRAVALDPEHLPSIELLGGRDGRDAR